MKTGTSDQSNPDSFERLMADEAAAREERRRQAGVDPELPTVGLALSGGGIRSATFSLGLLRALARNGVLPRIDMISSVSGGGYIAATLGRLFARPGVDASGRAARAAPPPVDEGATVAQDGGSSETMPFGHLARALSGRSVLMHWLRRNGRYLAPAGAADVGLSMVTYLRAAVAIQVEMAALAMLVGVMVVLPHLLHHADVLHHLPPELIDPWVAEALALQPEDRIWQSLWFPIAVGWLLLAAPFSVVRYWSIRDRSRSGWVLALILMVLVYSAIAWNVWNGFLPTSLVSEDVHGTLVMLLMTLGLPVVVMSATLGALSSISDSSWSGGGDPDAVARLRALQTRGLRTVVKVAVWLFAAGLLDRLSWSVLETLWSHRESVWWVSVSLLSVLMVMLRSHAESLLKRLDRIDRSRALRFATRLLPWSGLTLAFIWLVLWITLVQHLVFDPSWPTFWVDLGPIQRCALLFASALAWLLVFGRNVDVPNATSLHDFYRSRLVRAYVSVANPRRFAVDCAQVATERNCRRVLRDAELLDGDDVDLADYQPEAAGGPAHLINVCINQTRDDRAGLFEPDRKGLPMAISHHGFDIGTDEFRPIPRDDDREAREIRGTLGRWVAVSAAAVAPGAGARTVIGSALLMFLFGVRLGYWWKPPEPKGATRDWRPGSFLRKPSLFLREALANFAGTSAPYWYLSDGGHFDNTGVYALLKRRFDFIVLADCSADPGYALRDIENLVRKARIDLDARIEFYSTEQARIFFRRLERPGLAVVSPHGLGRVDARSVLLARVTYAAGDGPPGTRSTGTLLVFKPTRHAALDFDLLAYASKFPAFPHQPTSDQFFDEAQWESYQRLGEDLAEAATPEWLDCVPGWRGVRHPPMRPAPLPASDTSPPGDPATGWRSAAATAAVGGGLGLASLGALVAPALDIADRFQLSARESSRNPADLLDRLGDRFNSLNGSTQVWSLGVQRDIDLLRSLVDSQALDQEPRSQAVDLLKVAQERCRSEQAQQSAVCKRLKRDAFTDDEVAIFGLPVTLERLDYWRRSTDETAGPWNWLASVTNWFTRRGVVLAAPVPAGTDGGHIHSAAHLDGGTGTGPSTLAGSGVAAAIHFRVYREKDCPRAVKLRQILLERPLPGLKIEEISNVRTRADQSQARAPLKMRRTTLIYHGESMLARARQVGDRLKEADTEVSIIPLPSTVTPLGSILELWIGVDEVSIGSPDEQTCDPERLEKPPEPPKA